MQQASGFKKEHAEKLDVSRAAVAKWESGLSYPDISNWIQISDLMNVTVDYLVREQSCEMSPVKKCRNGNLCVD